MYIIKYYKCIYIYIYVCVFLIYYHQISPNRMIPESIYQNGHKIWNLSEFEFLCRIPACQSLASAAFLLCWAFKINVLLT